MAEAQPVEIHVGDVGTFFDLTVKDQDGKVKDISNPTELTVKLKPPGNNPVMVKTGVLTNDGTDGKMHYVAIEGDFFKAGEWEIQGFVKLDDGQWNSNIHRFYVLSNL
jgi:hypothetical protein